MDIEFLLEQANLSALLRDIHADQSDERGKVLLNSLLVLLVEQNITLSQLIQEMDPYLQSKEVGTKKTAAKTLLEVVRRNRDILCLGSQMEGCLRRLLPRAVDVPIANQAISILQQIVMAADQLSAECCSLLLGLFNDPRFHPTSHRQQVRLCCYRILLHLTKRCRDWLCVTPAAQTNFLRTVIDSTHEQKDPRNIGSVFQLYEWSCSNLDSTSLKPFLEQLYENLQAYYPIDFVGDDQEGESASLEELSVGLDWCVTHPVFAQPCLSTLVDKMGSPPIKQFLPTLNLFIIRNHHEVAHLPKLTTLLRRILQQPEFLDDVECHLQLIDCIDCLTQMAYTGMRWPAISDNLQEFLTAVLASAMDHRFLASQAGFSLNLVRVLAANLKAREFVSHFVVTRFLNEVTTVDTANESHAQLMLGMVVAASTSQLGLSQQLAGALLQRAQSIYGYAIKKEQQSLKLLILKILMSMPSRQVTGEIAADVLEMLMHPGIDQLYRKSLIDFMSSRDRQLSGKLRERIEQSMPTPIQKEADAQVVVYGVVWSADFKFIERLVESDSELLINALLEQLSKLPLERRLSLLLRIQYTKLSVAKLLRFEAAFEQAHGLWLASDEDTFPQQISSRLVEAVQQKNFATLLVLCGWRSAFSGSAVPREFLLELEKGSAPESMQGMLLRQLVSILPLQYIAALQFELATTRELTVVRRIRQLDLPLILHLRGQLQSRETGYEGILSAVSNPSKHDYPTLRQLLAKHVLPVLLQQAENSYHLRQFFVLLRSIPLGELRVINDRIIKLILLQLRHIASDEESLMLCLDILYRFQEELTEERQEGMLPILIQQLTSHSRLQPILLHCIKLLHLMCERTFALKHQKSVVQCLKPLLGHRKRRVRQAVGAALSRWYNL